jgi:hypothetical protein
MLAIRRENAAPRERQRAHQIGERQQHRGSDEHESQWSGARTLNVIASAHREDEFPAMPTAAPAAVSIARQRATRRARRSTPRQGEHDGHRGAGRRHPQRLIIGRSRSAPRNNRR